MKFLYQVFNIEDSIICIAMNKTYNMDLLAKTAVYIRRHHNRYRGRFLVFDVRIIFPNGKKYVVCRNVQTTEPKDDRRQL